jgi:hypothetical protein
MEMLRGIPMHMTAIKPMFFASFTAATILLTACDANPKEWKTPNMTTLTPRLHPLFEKTKTVCFGRFVVDVPASATVAWGDAIVSLDVSVYPNGVDEVKTLAQKFIDQLKREKAINHDDAPLLLSVEDVHQPEGKIVTGYEDFQSIDDLKINGYFRLNNDGMVVNARPLRNEKDETIAEIKSIARRLRQRAENEVPTEAGNCIEYAFLPDEPGPHKGPPGELIRIGFRLKEFPDTHLSIQIRPQSPDAEEEDTFKWQLERAEREAKAQDSNHPQLKIKYFRRGDRQIHEWVNGFEALGLTAEQAEAHSIHDFGMDFKGVPTDPLKPHVNITMQTGVANNAAGATKPSLTDEEAIAVWDKITSTIRVRPTSATPVKSADAGTGPRLALGEMAATGRTCPQTGWWEPSEPGNVQGDRRQHFKAGDRMPHVTMIGAPSMWQKLKGEQPSYRTATVWKLVDYGDAPTQPPTIAQATQDKKG